MAEKNKEDKMILEREYVVPLRRKWQNTPGYKRVPKAVKALKEFIAKHMKIYDRDLDKVKLDRYLNEEMWMRSIRKPLAKVKIKAKKFEKKRYAFEHPITTKIAAGVSKFMESRLKQVSLPSMKTQRMQYGEINDSEHSVLRSALIKLKPVQPSWLSRI